MRLLSKFTVVLLDLNGMCMFGEDKFGVGEDFYTTYCAIGGRRLSAAEVTRYARACYECMSRVYADPQCYEDFTSLTEGLQRYACPPGSELRLLEQVFTLHEVGAVPSRAAAVLRRLVSTHKLALVTNIWAPKGAWLAEFERVGLAD